MNTSFFIAKRYIISKKSHNAINIISMVSVCGIVLATAALVCALSVFNGFNDLVATLFSNFDPDLKISVRVGKVFDPTTAELRKVKQLKDIAYFSEVLQDNALVRYVDRQTVATLKGVDDSYEKLTRIDSVLVDGKFTLHDPVVNYATLGIGLASLLGVKANFSQPLEIYVPKRDENVNLANPATSFDMEYAFVGGVYSVNQQIYDEGFMLIPISLARTLFRYDKEVSSIEIGVKDHANVKSVQKEIKKILGDKFVVKDRFEQQDASYKMMQAEKWMTFLILCFILMLALFNVIGSLAMLMIEKSDDVITLRNLGASNSLVRRIFLFEGWMISGFGALIGILIGLILCFLQQKFGLIGLGGASESFIIDAYPVRVAFGDILTVFVTVISIGFLAAWYPVHYFGKKWIN